MRLSKISIALIGVAFMAPVARRHDILWRCFGRFWASKRQHRMLAIKPLVTEAIENQLDKDENSFVEEAGVHSIPPMVRE